MPTLNQPRYLLACDFDDTLFRTSRPSPNNMNVKRAYILALDDVLGKGTGEWYMDLFGLRSKAPSEIIKEIIDWEIRCNGDSSNIVARAWEFYEKEGKTLGELVPEAKNDQLIWGHDSPESTMGQMLVGQKLKYLLKEIGQNDGEGNIWPPPCTDALNFLRTVEELRSIGVPIDLAIISSGHDSFIRKAFEVWGIRPPEILVSEDDIRPRKYPVEMERRVKPGQLPLALAHYKWLKQQELVNDGVDGISVMGEAVRSKERIVYFGEKL